ncbi:hypothetical protein MTO96_028933 [Rhipicephalus appendiculatus]
MTEVTCCVTCSSHLDDSESVGKPVPFAEMKVVDFNTRRPLGAEPGRRNLHEKPCCLQGLLESTKSDS